MHAVCHYYKGAIAAASTGCAARDAVHAAMQPGCVCCSQVCEGVGDVVAWVAEVLHQALNGLGAAGQGLHTEADERHLHTASNKRTATMHVSEHE